MAIEFLLASVEKIESTSTYTVGIGTGPWTWSGWIYPLSLPPTFAALFQNTIATDGFELVVAQRMQPGSNWGFYDGSSRNFNTTLTNDVWQHLLITRDSSDLLTGYVDGVAEAATFSGITTSVSDGQDWHIGGRDGGSPAQVIDARVAEVGLWADELNLGEIAGLFNGNRPGDVRRQDLVLYVDCIRGAEEQRDFVNGSLWEISSGTPATADHPRMIPHAPPRIYQTAAAAAAVSPGAFLKRFEHQPAPNPLLRM